MAAQDELIPWLSEEEKTLPFDQYAKHAGIDQDEPFTWVLYGLPLLPPNPGETLARVSLAHGDRWRTMVAVWLEGLAPSTRRPWRKTRGGAAPGSVRPAAHDISGVGVPIRVEAFWPGIRTRLRSREATWRAGGEERLGRRRPRGKV